MAAEPVCVGAQGPLRFQAPAKIAAEKEEQTPATTAPPAKAKKGGKLQTKHAGAQAGKVSPR